MAITVVQTVAVTAADSGNLPNPTAPGNTVIVAYAGSAGAGSSSTPSVSAVTLGGSADNFAQQIQQHDGASASVSTIWMDANCTGGQTSLAVTGSLLVAADGFLFAMEVAGLGSSPVLGASSAGPLGAGTRSWTSNNLITSQANALLAGVTAHGPNGVSNILSGPATPWVNTASFAWSDGAALAGYQLPSSAGTFSYAGSSSDFDNYTAVIVALYPGGVSFQGPVTITVPPSWKAAYSHLSRPVLPQPPAPLVIAAQDVSGTTADAGEGIALASADASTAADSSVITAASSDSDAAAQASDTSVITAASSDSDASGAGLDAGETVTPAIPVSPAVRISPAWTAAFRHDQRPVLPLAAVPVFLITASDASTSTDAASIGVTSADASGAGADGFEFVAASLASADASTGTDASVITVAVSDTDASRQAADASTITATVPSADASGTALDAGERLLVNPQALPGSAQPGTAWLSRFGHRHLVQAGVIYPQGIQLVSDTETCHGIDAGALLGGIDADASHGEDSGFTFIAASDASHGADLEVPLAQADTDLSTCADIELTAWPRDADASISADAGFWSGVLTDTDAGHGTEAGTLNLADTDASTGTETHIVRVYSFQPPFRFTGGGYEVIHSGRTVIAGTVPVRRVLELAADLAAAREVSFVASGDYCAADDRHVHEPLAVQVRCEPLAVAVSWEAV